MFNKYTHNLDYRTALRFLQNIEPCRSTTLALTPDELTNLNLAQKETLCEAIRHNTHYTHLIFHYPTEACIDDAFLILLKNALETNSSVTDLHFTLGDQTANNNYMRPVLDAIATFLKRNRKLAIEKPLPPLPAADTPLKTVNPYIFLAALGAVKHGDLTLLHSNVSSQPDMVNLTAAEAGTAEGNETLLGAASQSGQVSCVKYLLQAGAKVNLNPPLNPYTQSLTGSALNYAVANSKFVITELLLKAGADITAKREGHSVLHDVKEADTAELLLAHNANPLMKIDTDTNDYVTLGNSVLHSIINNHSLSLPLLQLFFQYPSLLNAQNKLGQTPLHSLLVTKQPRDAVTYRLALFLRAGANPTLRDSHNSKPADYAKEAKLKTYAKQVTEDYKTIHMVATLLKQGTRTTTQAGSTFCFFSTLPKDCSEIIIENTLVKPRMDETTRTILIRRFLGH